MGHAWPSTPARLRRLRKGDRVAVLSLSSGIATSFPKVFERGLDALRSLDLEPVLYPTAAMGSDELYQKPRARARDLMHALADDAIAGIVSSIGGYESIRLYEFYRPSIFARNPKMVLGGSDATTYLLYGLRAGITGLYGPSVMAGFSQMDDLPDEFREHVRRFLFGRWKTFEYAAYPSFVHGYTGWSESGKGGIGKSTKVKAGWDVLQGERPVTGRLWGGCIEVVEFLKGTRYWPPLSYFDDSVLFFETSEEKPAPERVGYMLRNYGVAGILGRAKALLIGRPKDYTDAESTRLKKLLVEIVRGEFGRGDMPIVCDVDFGHTDPKILMPMGGKVRIDPALKRITLLENPFQ